MADDLLTYGVAVVPITEDAATRARMADDIFAAMDEFPEYLQRGRDLQRVLGGFGALGNPSSFHHPVVRAYRCWLKNLWMHPIACDYARHKFGAQAGTVRLEAMFDRLCVRKDDFKAPSAEAWHRDIYDADAYGLRPLPHSLPGGELDILFGGWSNLDERDQVFVGLVGTHDEAFDTSNGGFATFSDADIRRLRFNERLAGQAGATFGRTIRCNGAGEIVVPPGHAIVFLQRLVHSVKSGAQPRTPALRVFHGFRLTTDEAPLFDHRRVVETGAVPRLPSGQIPPMYSKNHYAAFAGRDPRWREWAAATFQPACLFQRVTPGGIEYSTPGSRGNANRLANAGRYMPSLSEMGLLDDSFAYSREELQALYPEPLFP